MLNSVYSIYDYNFDYDYDWKLIQVSEFINVVQERHIGF